MFARLLPITDIVVKCVIDNNTLMNRTKKLWSPGCKWQPENFNKKFQMAASSPLYIQEWHLKMWMQFH
jgi:hypothetical protein